MTYIKYYSCTYCLKPCPALWAVRIFLNVPPENGYGAVGGNKSERQPERKKKESKKKNKKEEKAKKRKNKKKEKKKNRPAPGAPAGETLYQTKKVYKNPI